MGRRLCSGWMRSDSVELHRQIGFLPAELNLWKNQRADRILRYLASVRGDEGSLLAEAARLAARLELDTTRRIRAYSSGNRRKLGLVIAMMHKPGAADPRRAFQWP